MPVIDIQIILAQGEQLRSDLAAELANKLGQVLNAAPGQLWLRLQTLPSSNYAENNDPASKGLPVFVTVMHAQAKAAEAMQTEAVALAQAVSGVLARARTHVHIEYAPPGAGRVAFGGSLIH